MRMLAITLLTIAFSLNIVLPATAHAEETPSPVIASNTVTRLEDDDLRVRFGGAWAHLPGSHPGQSVRRSSTGGASASASFEGTSCAFVSRKGPDAGQATIFVDAVEVGVVDLFAESTGEPEVVWSTDALVLGSHTVRVVVSGTHSAGSTGDRVVFDAFEVGGTPGPARVPGRLVQAEHSYVLSKGSWSTPVRTGAFEGREHRSRVKGSSMTIRFRGTAVAWIGRKGPNQGKAAVYLDGKKVATVSQYAPDASERRVIWSSSTLGDKIYSLTVKPLGASESLSSGEWVDVDAFAYTGRLLRARQPSPFAYPWRTYIVIDKSDFKLYWIKNGYLEKAYSIAHGREGMATPERVWRIDAKYHTSPGSVYGPRKMRMFSRVKTRSGYRYVFTAYAIHGTNQEWVIGTRASHGCIRMYNKQVLELFPQVPLGTIVVTRN